MISRSNALSAISAIEVPTVENATHSMEDASWLGRGRDP